MIKTTEKKRWGGGEKWLANLGELSGGKVLSATAETGGGGDENVLMSKRNSWNGP